MSRQRITCIVASLVATAIVVAIVVAWPQIRERYYLVRLRSASGEVMWELAAKLASLHSQHAEDWYLAKLEVDDWDVRARAAKGLVGCSSARAIGALLTLNHPGLEKPQPQTGTVYLSLYDWFGTGWSPGDTAAAVEVINNRVCTTGGSYRYSGRAQIYIASIGRRSQSWLHQTLQTVATTLADDGGTAREVVDRLANQKEDQSLRANARVMRRLLDSSGTLRTVPR